MLIRSHTHTHNTDFEMQLNVERFDRNQSDDGVFCPALLRSSSSSSLTHGNACLIAVWACGIVGLLGSDGTPAQLKVDYIIILVCHRISSCVWRMKDCHRSGRNLFPRSAEKLSGCCFPALTRTTAAQRCQLYLIDWVKRHTNKPKQWTRKSIDDSPPVKSHTRLRHFHAAQQP